MPPEVINDDGVFVTIRMDDGTVTTLPKEVTGGVSGLDVGGVPIPAQPDVSLDQQFADAQGILDQGGPSLQERVDQEPSEESQRLEVLKQRKELAQTALDAGARSPEEVLNFVNANVPQDPSLDPPALVFPEDDLADVTAEPSLEDAVPDELVFEDDFIDVPKQPEIVQLGTGDLALGELGVDQAAEAEAEPFRELAESHAVAQEGVADIQGQIADQLAEGLKESSDFAADEIVSERQARVAATNDARKRIENIRTAIEDVNSTTVNSKRSWGKPGSFNSVMGLVSAFIGGFLTPVLGKNIIQPMIDRAVELDINDQKSQISQAQGQVRGLQLLHNLGLEQAKSEEEARNIERLMRHESISKRMKAKAATLQSPLLQEQAQLAISQNDLKIEQIIQDIGKGQFSQSMSKLKVAVGQREARLNRRFRLTLQASKQRSQRELALDKKKIKDGKLPPNTIFDPKTGEVRGEAIGSDAEIKDFRLRTNARWNTLQLIRRFKRLKQDVGTINKVAGQSILQNPKSIAFIGLYNEIIAEYVRSISGAQASEKEADRLRKSFPLEGWLTGDTDLAVKSFARGLADRQNGLNRSANLNWNVSRDWLSALPSESRGVDSRTAFGISQDLRATDPVRDASFAEGITTPSEQADEALADARIMVEKAKQELSSLGNKDTQIQAIKDLQALAERMRKGGLDFQADHVDAEANKLRKLVDPRNTLFLQ